jgi:group I intron endonuclease
MEIYKITNTENNKIYIGKTSKNTNLRWRWHINSSRGTKNDTLITRAMRKYGIDKFKIEKIDEADSLEKLQEKEFFWINHFNSTDKEKGYNIQRGDENDNLVIHEDTKIKLVKGNKENKMNGKYKRNSSDMKTTHVGVHFLKSKKSWSYSITFNGEKVCKKRYETDYDAAIGRDIKLLELFDKDKALDMMNFPENYEKYVSKKIVEKERERRIKEKKSNYLGAFFEEHINRWSSAVVHKGKRYKKGTFIEERDAAEMADYIRVSNNLGGNLNFPEINYLDSNYIPPKTEDEKQKMKQKYPDYISDWTSTNGQLRYRVRNKLKGIDKQFQNLKDAIAFQKTII